MVLLLSMDVEQPREYSKKSPTQDLVGDNFCIRYNSELLNDMDVLISSDCAGWAMSFVWKRMLRRDGFLMRGSMEVNEEDDLASVGRTK